MTEKLYKVKIETDLMVVAQNENDAINIAKKNAPNEVAAYGRGSAKVANGISDIPDDWKSVIPYSAEGRMETRKCFEMVSEALVSERKELPRDEVEEIIKIKDGSKGQSVAKRAEIMPETRPDPKPRELDWHDTKSGRPLPKMRFVKSP